MEHYQKHRREYPHCTFETRALPPIDGITRLLTLASWYWDKFDIYTRCDPESVEDSTRFCIAYANTLVKRKPELDFDKTMYEVFMYYIHGGYYRLVKHRDNIANDFWMPLLKSEINRFEKTKN